MKNKTIGFLLAGVLVPLLITAFSTNALAAKNSVGSCATTMINKNSEWNGKVYVCQDNTDDTASSSNPNVSIMKYYCDRQQESTLNVVGRSASFAYSPSLCSAQGVVAQCKHYDSPDRDVYYYFAGDEGRQLTKARCVSNGHKWLQN